MAFVQIDLTPSIRYFLGKEAGRASIWATKTTKSLCLCRLYTWQLVFVCIFSFGFLLLLFFFHQSQSLFFKHIAQFTLDDCSPHQVLQPLWATAFAQ